MRFGCGRPPCLGDAAAAEATLDEHRLLCAHRRGPYGVAYWNRQVERWLAEETGEPIWSPWYAGRPLLVAANDYGLGLYNGDTGVAVMDDGVLRAVIAERRRTTRLRDQPARRRRDHARNDDPQEPGQPGRRGDRPYCRRTDSRLLTRELFYTAVTRAIRKVRVVGTEAGVRAAIARRAARASGLRLRLQD